MSVAPEPYLSACVAVLNHAIHGARCWAWDGAVSTEQLADLRNAIHNIPGLMTHWEECDVEWLRRSLSHYDVKWRKGDGAGLLTIFDARVAKG